MPEFNFKELSAAQIAEIINNEPSIKLLDVRELHEYEYCHLPKSIHCPLSQLPNCLEKANLKDKTEKIIVYCHHGIRSAKVASYLAENGFQNVYNLTGGIDAWSIELDSNIPRY
jgi:rhodanese-related sulfurtransferase